MCAISCTARSKVSWFACDGLVVPLTLRTNCSAAAWTSSFVAGGSKLFSGRMLRHMLPSVSQRSKKDTASPVTSTTRPSGSGTMRTSATSTPYSTSTSSLVTPSSPTRSTET